MIDSLAPYVEKLGRPLAFTKEEALKLKDEFLNDFKQTQVNRANQMLQKLNQGNQELQKLQANLTQVFKKLGFEFLIFCCRDLVLVFYAKKLKIIFYIIFTKYF